MKILFICPYPFGTAGGQRFRYEQYLDILREKGFEISISSFLTHNAWEILYKPGNTLKKAAYIIFGYLKRLFELLTIFKYDYIFIYREATPLGPPFFEFILTKIFSKKVIYDFDDAIWLPTTSSENSLVSKLKAHDKVGKILKWSYKASVGNQWLGNYAKQHAEKVIVNPTTVEMDYHKPMNLPNQEESHKENVTIGWTGTHSTLKYLTPIYPILEEIAKIRTVDFVIIADKEPEWTHENLTFYPWSETNEIKDLNRIDIGIMPLTKDKWSEGKCGFKAIQYLALEIPAIVTPVGINEYIVQHGKTGFIAKEIEDWKKYLLELIDQPNLRVEMGKAGRDFIANKFSKSSNTDNFLSIFS